MGRTRLGVVSEWQFDQTVKWQAIDRIASRLRFDVMNVILHFCTFYQLLGWETTP